MVFLDHVQNLHIHAEKTHKDSGAHCCMNMLILYMVQKTHTGPYYRVQALFMYVRCDRSSIMDSFRACLPLGNQYSVLARSTSTEQWAH